MYTQTEKVNEPAMPNIEMLVSVSNRLLEAVKNFDNLTSLSSYLINTLPCKAPLETLSYLNTIFKAIQSAPEVFVKCIPEAMDVTSSGILYDCEALMLSGEGKVFAGDLNSVTREEVIVVMAASIIQELVTKKICRYV